MYACGRLLFLPMCVNAIRKKVTHVILTAGMFLYRFVVVLVQVIKSRIQSAPTGTYSGFIDCARKTIAADGVAALWKGFGPAMARVRAASIAS